MSQKSIPVFLLGGIKMAKNFLGTGVMTTAVYSGIETSVKMAPLFILVAYAGAQPKAPMTLVSEN